MLSIQIDKEIGHKGQGKRWYSNGTIFIGEFNGRWKKEGKKFKLQPDGTHTLYTVKYDENGHGSDSEDGEIEAKEVSKGHKMT